jgi:hypothetical protein
MAVRAQTASLDVAPIDAPLLTTNRILLESLARISRGSTLWRDAIDALRGTNRHALIVTPDDPLLLDHRNGHDCDAFDSTALAEVVPVLRQDSRVPLVIVVVNLALVRQFHDARLSAPRDLQADVDRILVHEVYGHAVPYLLAGSLSGRCADPERGQRASDACSIRRENAVRAELGLGQRADDGLLSLSLARRPY